MSRYMVNKAMWEVDMSDSNLERFKSDPGGFLAGWENAYHTPEPPCPSGGVLSDEERRALEALDFATLYAMGANPFILWQFARSVTVPDLMTIEALVVAFRDAVTPHGRPDFAT